MPTLTYSTTLTTTSCGVCEIPFAMPSNLLAALKEDGRSFWCPNGHKIHYGESENARLQRRLDWAETSRRAALDQAETAEYRRRAAVGQVTKIKRRIAAGVCPCCKRTFQNLTDHMAGQHPGYADPA